MGRVGAIRPAGMSTDRRVGGLAVKAENCAAFAG